MNRSFKFDGKKSFSFDRNKFTRSNTSRLSSEIGSSLSSRFSHYENLSRSMRITDDVESNSNHGRRSRNGAWAFVTKFFSLKKAGGDTSAGRMIVTSSSWRPDPNCRWPVQGW